MKYTVHKRRKDGVTQRYHKGRKKAYSETAYKVATGRIKSARLQNVQLAGIAQRKQQKLQDINLPADYKHKLSEEIMDLKRQVAFNNRTVDYLNNTFFPKNKR